MPRQRPDEISAFLVSLQAGGKSSATIKWSRQRLGQFACWLDPPMSLPALTIGDLDVYVAELYARNLSEHTVHGHKKLLRQFFKWCVRRGLLSANPTDDWKLGSPPRPDAEAKSVRLDDVLKLLDACRSSVPPRDVRDEAIVRLLYGTGLRAGELAGLRLRDLRFSPSCTNRSGHVPCAVHVRRAKGAKHRRVYPTAGDVKALRIWLDHRPQAQDDHVFLCRNASYPDWHAFTYWGLREMVRRLGQRAEVKVSLHGFRHGFAIQYLENGGDLSTVSDLLGHSDIGVTKLYYATFESDRLARAAERYGPGNSLDEAIEEATLRQLLLDL